MAARNCSSVFLSKHDTLSFWRPFDVVEAERRWWDCVSFALKIFRGVTSNWIGLHVDVLKAFCLKHSLQAVQATLHPCCFNLMRFCHPTPTLCLQSAVGFAPSLEWDCCCRRSRMFTMRSARGPCCSPGGCRGRLEAPVGSVICGPVSGCPGDQRDKVEVLAQIGLVCERSYCKLCPVGAGCCVLELQLLA